MCCYDKINDLVLISAEYSHEHIVRSWARVDEGAFPMGPADIWARDADPWQRAHRPWLQHIHSSSRKPPCRHHV